MKPMVKFTEKEIKRFCRTWKVSREDFLFHTGGYRFAHGSPNKMIAQANKDRVWTEEMKNKMSRSLKRYYKENPEAKKLLARHGEKNGMYGVSRKGKDNPNYGRKHSAETRKNMSDVAKGRKASETTKQKISNNSRKMWAEEGRKKQRSLEWKKRGIKPPSPKGKLWWNDGEKQQRCQKCPGLDWIRGRLNFSKVYSNQKINQNTKEM